MIRTLDASMLGLSCSVEEAAPWAAKYGFQAVSASRAVLEDREMGKRTAAALMEHGLSWGLMPMPADFYHWDLSDAAFQQALETLRREADLARILGVTHAYNHVWSSSPRPFEENFEWTVKRIRAVNGILAENGVSYGLEFLGPHELRSMQKYEFIHSLSGALALADAAGGGVGIAFDVYHWYCSQNGAWDDVMLMEQQIDRLVAVHLSDAVEGRKVEEQKDMERRLPLETGIIDAKGVLSRFSRHKSDALYVVEPFDPWKSRFREMETEKAVRLASAALSRVEE